MRVGPSQLQIEYVLMEGGWAKCCVHTAERSLRIVVSYLHDSLRELAAAALALHAGADRVTVTFMAEPGEHQMLLERSENGDLAAEIRHYRDWASWGFASSGEYETVFKASTSVASFLEQVKDALEGLHWRYGVAEYQARWIEHDFPLEELERLRAAWARL